ncbi:15018_t:CDS:2 [Funneliformis caledonium]|uniref:15018_t:CDS:1 n=1 Tax=Funneliformis caledonium TaxID=1117310 RepID=A0A9N8VCX7_9GLOM|nr:15018_t:CDS:2 [Funneliformis caledonium]
MASTEGGTTSVKVALRIKPLTEEDLEKLPTRFQRQILTTPSNALNQLIVEGDKRQIFHFDHVFPPETTQQEVYERAVENLVDKFLEGYNVTILAYGQTSSGKTYTMGTADNPSTPLQFKGIIPRAMSTLFNIMNNSSIYLNRKFSITVSFIEIYNEDLIDLLGEGEGECRPQVMIREDSKGNIYWSGLQEVQVNNVNEVMAYLAQGSMNRQVGATDMNSKSSRSHAIFSVTMSQQKLVSYNGPNGYLSPPPGSRPTTPSSKLVGSRANSRLDHADDGDWVTITSKFHFVDLAGSERLKRTAASGDRAKEGISINSGLLALGNVISALGDPTKAKHTTHIPYRDSKLTRLLQDSLGGNAQTLMIACVSPAEYNLNETVNTLKYANRARNIKNVAAINQEETGWNDIGHLQNLVIKLRSDVTNLKVALANTNTNNGISNGTISPGRVTPIGGRETPSSRIKSPTAGHYSSLPTGIGGRVTPTISGIPGRSTPTSSTGRITPGITGRTTPSASSIPTGIPGRNTPTKSSVPSGIPGRNTPTSGISSGIPGRKTPTGIPGRNTPTSPSGIPGRNTPTRRPPSPLTTFSHGNHPAQNHRDVEILEEQLFQLKQSYAELSKRHAKTSAELAMHQDNYDELNNLKAGNVKNFMKGAEPVIEEYEKSISSLESKLAITAAALSHSEANLKAKDEKLITLTKNQEQTKSLNSSLQKYIKELESKLENHNIETKLATTSDEHPEKFISETVKMLEERLTEREVAFKELEEKLKQADVNQERQELLNKIDNRDKRISVLDVKLNLLEGELKKFNGKQDSTSESSTANSDLESKLTDLQSSYQKALADLNLEREKNKANINEVKELQKTLKDVKSNGTSEQYLSTIKTLEAKLRKTETELDDTKSKYENSVLRIQELQLSHDNNSEFSSTPMTPMTPATPQNEYYFKEPSNANVLSKFSIHRKAKSLSIDLKGSERRDLAHTAIVEKLQFELKLFESFHKDKQQSLDAVRHELDLLEIDYQETLQLVDELREELQRRDDKDKSISEVETTDEINQQLQKEVEQLTKKQNQLLQNIAEREIENNKKVEEIERLESNIRDLRSQMAVATPVKENEEAIILRERVAKLQAEVVSNADHVNIIKRLESELREVKEAHKLVIQEKNKLTATSTDASDETSSDKLEQNVDENVMVLQDTVRHLEAQLKMKDKGSQQTSSPKSIDSVQNNIDTSDSISSDVDQDSINTLQSQVSSLKLDIKNKDDLIDTLKQELEDKDLLQKNLKNKETELASLSKQLSDFRNKDEDMRKRIKELELHLESAESIRETNKLLENEFESVKKELIDVKEKEAHALEQLCILEGSSSKVQQELERIRNLEVAQQERIVTLEAQLSEQGTQFDSEFTNLTSALKVSKESEIMNKQTIAELESKLNKSESVISTLQSEIEVLNSKENETLSKLRNELSDTKLEMESRNELLSELESLLISTEKERNQYHERADELSKLIEEQEEEKISDLETQLGEAKISDERYVGMIDELKSTLKESNTHLMEKHELIFTKENHIKELETTIKKINDKLSDAELSKTSESEHVKSLRDKIAEIEAKLEQSPSPADFESAQQYAAKQVSKLNENIDKLTEELRETRSAEEAQKSLVHELDSELKEKEEKMAELKETLNSTNALLEKVKVTENKQAEFIQNLESQLKDMKDARDLREKEISELSRTNESLNDQCMRLHNEIKDVHNESARQSEESLNILEELNNQLEIEKNEHLSDKENLENQMQKLQKEIGLMSNEYLSDKEALEQQVQKLQKEIDLMSNGHLSDKETLEQQVQKLQKEIGLMSDEIIEIARKYEDAEELSAEYKQRISNLEIALEESKKLSSDKLKADETQNTRSIPALETSEFGSKISQQDNLIKSLQEEIIELKQRTSDDNIIYKHEAEIRELNQEISKLEKMNEEKSKLIDNLEGLVKDDEVEMKGLKQKLEKLLREKDDLLNEIEDLRVKLEEKTDQHEQLMSIQKEKEEIETSLEKEKLAKKNVEVAYANLENQFEELQGGKKNKFLSKFMCF